MGQLINKMRIEFKKSKDFKEENQILKEKISKLQSQSKNVTKNKRNTIIKKRNSFGPDSLTPSLKITQKYQDITALKNENKKLKEQIENAKKREDNLRKQVFVLKSENKSALSIQLGKKNHGFGKGKRLGRKNTKGMRHSFCSMRNFNLKMGMIEEQPVEDRSPEPDLDQFLKRRNTVHLPVSLRKIYNTFKNKLSNFCKATKNVEQKKYITMSDSISETSHDTLHNISPIRNSVFQDCETKSQISDIYCRLDSLQQDLKNVQKQNEKSENLKEKEERLNKKEERLKKEEERLKKEENKIKQVKRRSEFIRMKSLIST